MIGKLNQFKNHPILGVDDHRMFGILWTKWDDGDSSPGTIGALADCTAGPKGADSENRLSGEKFDSMTWIYQCIHWAERYEKIIESLLFKSSIPIPVSHFHVPPESWKIAHSLHEHPAK